MSHEIEQMFSASREKPWHYEMTKDRTKILENAPTSKEAIELAGLNWVVEGKPIYDANGKEIYGFKANTRSSDNSILGIVTNKYKVVQNFEAFDFTDNLIGEEMFYETAGSLKNGKTIWLLGKLPEKYIVGDKFEPYVCFTNSHDGTGAIKIAMTPIRVVCNNTLNMAISGAKRIWSTKHMGSLAIEADKLANTKMDEDEVIKTLNEMFPLDEDASDRQKQNVQNAKDGIMYCMLRPDLVQFLNTRWGFINAVSDFVGHASPARMTDNYEENNWGRSKFLSRCEGKKISTGKEV